MSGTWLSESGSNLTFSIIVHPLFILPEQQFLLNKVVALSVFDLLTELGLHVHIKWPNDIICEQGKLSGILIENILQGALIRSSVIGIGINLNQLLFPEGSGVATSLKLVTGKNYPVDETLNSFMVCFERRYSALYQALAVAGSGASSLAGQSQPGSVLDAAYLGALYGFLEYKTYEIAGQQVSGKIVGISGSGEVQLEYEGRVAAFWLKEIKLVTAGPSPF